MAVGPGLYVTVKIRRSAEFNTDLVSEYQALADHLGFTADEVERLSLNALQASFCRLSARRLERDFVAELPGCGVEICETTKSPDGDLRGHQGHKESA